MQGLQTSASTRQVNTSVITEEAKFLPYFDLKPADALSSIVQVDKTVDMEEEEINLQQYAEDCSRMAFKILQKIANSQGVSEGKIPNKEFLEELSREESEIEALVVNVEKYLTNQNCGIMQCLDKINSLPEGPNFVENLKTVLEALEDDVSKDALMSTLLNGNVLKDCLDTVIENYQERTLRILSMGSQQFLGVVDKLLTAMEESNPMLYTDLTADSGNEETSLFSKLISSQPLLSDGSQPYSLLMVDGLVSESENVAGVLSNLADAVATSGFVLLKEVTHNLTVVHLLQRFFKDCTVLLDSEQRDFCSFLKKESWESLFCKNTDFELVSSCTDAVMSSIFLLRKIPSQADSEQQTVVYINSETNFDWLPVLQKQLAFCQKTPKEHNLWLVANGKPYSGIVGMVKCLATEPGGHCLR